MIMLVGFCIPVLLEAVALKKAPPNDASRFLPTRAIRGVVKSMVKCKICKGIQKPTRAVVRSVIEREENIKIYG